MAVVINHRHPVAGIAFAHAACARWPQRRAIAHNVVQLCLAKHFIHHNAQLVAAVIKHGRAYCFTCAHQALQFDFEMFVRLGVGLQHGFECSREQKSVRDALLLHQAKSQFRAKAAIKGDDGPAKIQGGQQGIHQAPCPGPICRAPKNSA